MSKNNPIIKNKGVCDPHIHIFEDTAYLYASHDKSPENNDWLMDDWVIYKSNDLIDWEYCSTIKPEDTYIGKWNKCWATDCATKNGKYYLYLSKQDIEIAVLVSNYPDRGFVDVLGKPLISKKMVDTHCYDPCVFVDDDGKGYILFGCTYDGNFFIAELNEDMISLKELPKKIVINNMQAIEDKCFLHKKNGFYYLSFGSFYAISSNIYGSYDYKDTIKNSFDHSSFFEFKGQDFNAFTIYDKSHFFRAIGLNYIAYDENNCMQTYELAKEFGVGYYNADWNKIEFYTYLQGKNVEKKQNYWQSFDICVNNESTLLFKNIENLQKKKKIAIFGIAECDMNVIVRENDENGNIVAVVTFKKSSEIHSSNWHMELGDFYSDVSCLHFSFLGKGRLQHFKFFE